MYAKGKEVHSVSIHQALLDLIEYLKSKNQPILVGHNIKSFDIPILSRLITEFGLLPTFLNLISACIDTLKLAKKVVPKSEITNYKKTTLVKKMLGIEYEAHDALEDVKSLHQLFQEKLRSYCRNTDLFPFNEMHLESSYKEAIQGKKISKTAARRLANSGLGLNHLRLAFRRNPDDGVKSVLLERGFQGRTVSAIKTFLLETTESIHYRSQGTLHVFIF
jgi:DNA polymerase III alpha subunit (gram-positive type)